MSFIIGLMGYSNTGKGTYCSFVREELGIPSLNTGDIVRDEVRKKGLEVTPQNIVKISNEMRAETQGSFMDFARLRLENLLKDNEIIIVDSLRELSDKKYLCNYASTFKALGIYASKAVRYQRICLRKRDGDPLTMNGFLELEEREKSLGTESLLRNTDLILFNNGTVNEFYKDSILKTKKLIGWKE